MDIPVLVGNAFLEFSDASQNALTFPVIVVEQRLSTESNIMS